MSVAGPGEAWGHMGSCGGSDLGGETGGALRSGGVLRSPYRTGLSCRESPLGYQGNNSGLYLLNPLLSLSASAVLSPRGSRTVIYSAVTLCQ